MENIATGALLGSGYGALKEVWKTGPASARGVQNSLRAAAGGVVHHSVHFAIVGGLYSVGSELSAGARDKNDSINGMWGGSFAGAYIGLRGGGLHGAVYKGMVCGAAGLACAYLSSNITRKYLK